MYSQGFLHFSSKVLSFHSWRRICKNIWPLSTFSWLSGPLSWQMWPSLHHCMLQTSLGTTKMNFFQHHLKLIIIQGRKQQVSKPIASQYHWCNQGRLIEKQQTDTNMSSPLFFSNCLPPCSLQSSTQCEKIAPILDLFFFGVKKDNKWIYFEPFYM